MENYRTAGKRCAFRADNGSRHIRINNYIHCLPYAAGKQPSIPLINFGRTWALTRNYYTTTLYNI